MTEKPNNENEPFNESNLNSAEYRDRLTRKLNCLIALLEVAMARVRRSLSGPDPDVERLSKISRPLRLCVRRWMRSFAIRLRSCAFPPAHCS
ncbi:MAG: hypothetical protein ACI9F9_000893, partial [Candidatus Paceibacteria bacterium]